MYIVHNIQLLFFSTFLSVFLIILYNWTHGQIRIVHHNTSSSQSLHHNKLLAFYFSRFTIYHKSLANLRVALAEYTLIKYAEASEKEVDTEREMKEGESLKMTVFFLHCGI